MRACVSREPSQIDLEQGVTDGIFRAQTFTTHDNVRVDWSHSMAVHRGDLGVCCISGEFPRA